MSQYIYAMKEGEYMEMEGPKGRLHYKGNGNFYLGETENKKYMLRRELGMIAGGTGITPLY